MKICIRNNEFIVLRTGERRRHIANLLRALYSINPFLYEMTNYRNKSRNSNEERRVAAEYLFYIV